MAASANPINGTAYVLKVSTDAGVSWDTVAHVQSASFSAGMEPRDTTTKDSAGWRELGEGLRSWSMTGSGLVAYSVGTDEASPKNLFDIYTARTKAKFQFTTANTGDFEWEGDGYITEFSQESGVEDNVTFSISIEGSGPLAVAAVS
jgi:TP901-1 family phage major tail protein